MQTRFPWLGLLATAVLVLVTATPTFAAQAAESIQATVEPSCGRPGTRATITVSGLTPYARYHYLSPRAENDRRSGIIGEPRTLGADAQGTISVTETFLMTTTVRIPGAFDIDTPEVSVTFNVPCP